MLLQPGRPDSASPRARHLDPVLILSPAHPLRRSSPFLLALSPRASRGAWELRAEQSHMEGRPQDGGGSACWALSRVAWMQAGHPSPAPQTVVNRSQLGQQGRPLLPGLAGEAEAGLALMALELGDP